MSKQDKIAALILLGGILSNNQVPGIHTHDSHGKDRKPKHCKEKLPHIPKGCSMFDFTNKKGERVFRCVAVNEKTAHKKFDKWLQSSNK